MKLWNKIFCVILSGMLMLPVLSSCKENDSQKGKTETIENGSVYTGGTHIFNVKDTSDYLVKDGKSDYKIVVPSDASNDLLTQVMQMNSYIKQAIGSTLPVVEDGEVSYSEQEKFISVGFNDLCEDLNFDKSNLNYNGVRILTKGKSIFVYGATESGTICAIYEFLHQIINYNFYASDCVVFDKGLKDIPLKEYDITDLPDFAIRQSGYQIGSHVEYRATSNVIATLSGGQWHNSFLCLAPGDYKDEHPEWYALNGQQLCYTARGNQEELTQMRETVLEKMKADIEAQPNRLAISFTIEDMADTCTCDSCREVDEKYGARAATMILFLKPIAAEIDAWLQETDPERDLTILFFSYASMCEAPAVLVNGEYQPTHEDMRLLDNMAVVFAPIEADYWTTFEDDINSSVYQNMKGWASLTDNMWYWTYGFNINDYFAPFDTFNSLKENYIIMLNHDAKWLFQQCQYDEYSPTHFSYLDMYLQSKLQWNVNQDVNELIVDFMENYFKDAAPIMTQYLNEMRAHFSYLRTEKGYGGRISVDMESDMYSYPLLLHWNKFFEEAYKVIEKYKTQDVALYDALEKRILRESLCVRYLLITLYGPYYSFSELQSMKLEFKKDCGDLGVKNMREHASISMLWQSWGI